VFVSSWVLNADMWEYQVRFFRSHGYRCILPDRRGHGRSDRPPSGYDLDTRADDLAALIDHLDLRDITLVADSAGGARWPATWPGTASSEPPGSGSSPPPCRS
jgi:non-heme chloroperoxidase